MKVWVYKEWTYGDGDRNNDQILVFAHQRAALYHLRNRVEEYYDDSWENIKEDMKEQAKDDPHISFKINYVDDGNIWSVTPMTVTESAAEKVEDSMPFSKDRVFDEYAEIFNLNETPFPTEDQLQEIGQMALDNYLKEVEDGGLAPTVNFMLDKAISEYFDRHPDKFAQEGDEFAF